MNYKRPKPQMYMDYGGVSWPFDIDTEKFMIIQKVSTASTHLSMENEAVDYQVPTGKKFVIINAVDIDQVSTMTQDKIYYSDDADASTNPINILIAGHGIANGDPFIFTVPAGKYINYFDASSSHLAKLAGIETDA